MEDPDPDPRPTRTNRSPTALGIDPDKRSQVLLDDLREEVGRVADAIERQNQLLEEINTIGEVRR